MWEYILLTLNERHVPLKYSIKRLTCMSLLFPELVQEMKLNKLNKREKYCSLVVTCYRICD